MYHATICRVIRTGDTCRATLSQSDGVACHVTAVDGEEKENVVETIELNIEQEDLMQTRTDLKAGPDVMPCVPCHDLPGDPDG